MNQRQGMTPSVQGALRNWVDGCVVVRASKAVGAMVIDHEGGSTGELAANGLLPQVSEFSEPPPASGIAELPGSPPVRSSPTVGSTPTTAALALVHPNNN